MRKKIDWILLLSILAICFIGLSSIFSSSFTVSKRFTGNGYTFFYNHLWAFILGLVALIFFYKISLTIIFKYYLLILFTSLFLLVLVFIPGFSREVSGAKRWVSIGFIGMQPSEIAKLSFLIFISKHLTFKKDKVNFFLKGSFPSIGLIGIGLLLIFLEPDISTTFLIGFLAFSIFFYTGVPFIYLVFSVCLSLPIVLLFFESKKYWVSRLLFFNPYTDPYGKGYHLMQSLMGFRQGGFLGEGPGAFVKGSRPLPDAHTDFIFSVIGQELGLLGCFALILFFIVFIRQALLIALRQKKLEYHLLGLGIGLLVSFEVIIHMFVTIGLMPTTGLPLPFVSFGRTSLVVHFAMVGLLLNLNRVSYENQ